MGMKQTLAVINAMAADGVIGRYAISGAIAADNYVEAAVLNRHGLTEMWLLFCSRIGIPDPCRVRGMP
jgi:hypothetical protein